MPRGYTREEAIAKFWSRVEITDGCWLWTGAKFHNGYGNTRFLGREIRAHRLSWELHHGRPFPEGMLACHHCDNPACVRPDHLFVGTHRDNALDAVRKGRVVPPERLPFTHCKRGHKRTPENTYYPPKQLRATLDRRCRICATMTRRLRYERLLASKRDAQ